MKQRYIAIVDFGSQYMHLITRRIRQLGVHSKIFPTDVNAHELKDAWGVIISGGPNDVNDQKLTYDPGVFDLPIPILGLCYGHQLMTQHLGGVVTSAHNREYGMATVEVLDKRSILAGLDNHEQVWMSHWDSVTQVPEGFTVIGRTSYCPVAAMANEKDRRYGLQFHVEVNHTLHGMKILENFVFDICGAEKNWNMIAYIQNLKNDLKKFVGEKKIFLLVSGGVDSAVAFALLEQVLGKERVYGLHIDNGFMRLHESAHVEEALAAAGFDDLHVVDASSQFLSAVAGIVDPEAKRKIIGKTFLDIQKQVFDDLGFNTDEWLLGQGTIYPDTIESGGTKTADTIKTHHNRVDEVLEMINAGKVVEPLAELYKDEVREMGLALGLPETLVNRWPFPGPGLSIRVLCASGKEEPVANESAVNAELQKTVQVYGTGVSARVLPIRSVGVQGDQRSYQHPALVSTAEMLPWEQLNELSVRITNSITGVNRVVYHVGGALPEQGFQLHEAYLTKDRLELLRQVDAVVDEVIRAHGLYDAIWQLPAVLLPLSASVGVVGEVVVLRPIESQEAMTVNFYPMDAAVLQEMVDRILAIEGVSSVLYDISNKPPATIEWE
ncbi:MAG: glutamine-hydrolyzing GMP synthase [Candidatus Kerfeldbacteria bacterium]|nr:glutamine-hydrolyzing GMP synthase [Candidatus Kerfeldbacteria bacterium]